MWKPTKTEMPTITPYHCSDRVLIQLEDTWIGVGYLNSAGEWHFDDESYVDVAVVAWMPLPPPYLDFISDWGKAGQEPPRLATYGDLRELQGRGLG